MASPISDAPAAPAQAVSPRGINHLVLNVRDIEESHRFWTEIVGLKQVAALRPRPDVPNLPKMRFYSGDHAGKLTHHDVAIVENKNLPPPPAEWQLFGPQAINHVAIAMPDRESWLKVAQGWRGLLRKRPQSDDDSDSGTS